MQNENKNINKILNDLPFYGLIGLIGLSVAAAVIFILYWTIAG